MRTCTAASLAVAAILASVAGHAELTSSVGPPRAFVMGNTVSDALRLSAVAIPSFSVVRPWIGVWGPLSLQWQPMAPPLSLEKPNGGSSFSFCLSPGCSFPRTSGLDVDPLTAAPTASRRAFEGIGPIAAAAIALFSSPPMKPTQQVVVRPSPMFAMGGVGLEMRGSWW